MAEAKFKVGDKVKVRKKYRMHPQHVHGVVTAAETWYRYEVEFPDADVPTSPGRVGWRYFAEELKRDDSQELGQHPTLDEVLARVEAAERVVLELTVAEAETLALVLSYMGGVGVGRRRMESLGRKLGEAGVRWVDDVNVGHYSEPMDPDSTPGLRLEDRVS